MDIYNKYNDHDSYTKFQVGDEKAFMKEYVGKVGPVMVSQGCGVQW